jgi:hypothetical protein
LLIHSFGNNIKRFHLFKCLDLYRQMKCHDRI